MLIKSALAPHAKKIVRDSARGSRSSMNASWLYKFKRNNTELLRGISVVDSKAHNLEVVGSIPTHRYQILSFIERCS